VSGDVFSPDALHAAVQSALNAPDVAIPDGHTHAFVTSWEGPGSDVKAFYAQKFGDRWTVQSGVSWHGGAPSVGFQLHGSWGG